MKKITVFTPTYNRAHLLPRLYNSLCAQSYNNFIWMVIDDGSTDDTEQLVKKWQTENKIAIEYHRKENGGMHTAHNTAYRLIETELNICIDSDDAMPPKGIETILNIWSFNEDKNIAGIIGLDADFNDNIIGTKIPVNLNKGTLPELYNKYKVKGDKKLVLKTEVVREYPKYPEFVGEKLVPLGSLYLMMAQHYKCIYTNEVLCLVDYQVDGSSNSIFRQYLQSPKGFAYVRKLRLKYNTNYRAIFVSCVHLISCGIKVKSLKIIFEGNNYKFLTLLLFPLGFLLYGYINYKAKNIC